MMIGWFAPSGRPIHVLLTKSDKLTRTEQATTLAAVRKGVGALGERVTCSFSRASENRGRGGRAGGRCVARAGGCCLDVKRVKTSLFVK